MKLSLKKLLVAVAFCIAPLICFAQSPGNTPGTSVTQTSIRADAAQFFTQTLGAVNTNATTTIPAGNGYIYIDYLRITVSTNATGTAQNQVQFTTTNLGGVAWQYSVAAAAEQNVDVAGNLGIAPLRAPAPGTAVTIIPPAAATNNSYQVVVGYHYAAQ